MFNTSGVQQKQESVVSHNLNEDFGDFRNSNTTSLTTEQTQQGNTFHFFCFKL